MIEMQWSHIFILSVLVLIFFCQVYIYDRQFIGQIKQILFYTTVLLREL